VPRDQHVRRLEIAVNDALLVRVLNGVADVGGERNAVGDGHPVPFAEGRDGLPANVLHHEEGPAVGARAGVEHPRDPGVIHERQGLALGLEPRDGVRGVHADLDDLERDFAANGLDLLGAPHLAHAAFPDALDEAVRTDPAGRRRASRRCRAFTGANRRRVVAAS